MDSAPVADRAPTTPSTDASAGPEAAQCPFPHALKAVAPGCPVPHGPGSQLPTRTTPRSKPDQFVRKLLRIQERPAGVSAATAYSTFQRSMLISATRCTLTYVVFPFLLPFLHILKGGAPVIGVFIGSVALVCDTFTIRRFFIAEHKWRWQFSAIAFSIMCLLSVLLVQDLAEIVRMVAN